jgi:prolyl-tRNA editing enzyme YbaK/EbsC (Cys-tRNA(Pro) deacylase)
MPLLAALHPSVADAVRRYGLDAEVVECDAELADTDAFCLAYGYSPDDSVNTILVAGKGSTPAIVACALLASDRLDVNGAVRRRLGAKKASFAASDLATELTSMERGGVTAIGLPVDVPVWIDARVLTRPRVILGGGNRTSKLLLAPDRLALVPGIEFVAGLTVTPAD